MSERLSFFDFVDRFVRVENPLTKRIEPMVLYPVQRAWAEAVFETFDADGLRRYIRAVLSLRKKEGKTALAGTSGTYMLLFDPFEPLDREVYAVATDLDQARLPWKAAVRQIRRSPGLNRFVKDGILRIYKDAIELSWGDVRGVFRCLASDTKGLHGISPSCLIVDETWTQPNYDLLEACALPPTRRCPLELHFSYAGLKGQQVEGNPLWDLFQAGANQTDPKLYFMYRSGRTPDAPWISETYLQQRERALPPNRFKRLHLNEWGAGDSNFVTDAEIARAFDGTVAPVYADRGHRWVAAVDYGRTKDHTAIALVRRDDAGAVVTGELVVLKGSPENPVPLELVEETLLDLRTRFNLTHVVADQWQMHGSIERLRAKMRIEPVSVGPAYLNRITLNFLSLMRSGRFKCFPHPDLEAQLGAVLCKETFYGVRIDSGAGVGVKGHDDIVMAVAMAAQLAIEKGGRNVLAAVVLAGAPSAPESQALRALRRHKVAQQQQAS